MGGRDLYHSISDQEDLEPGGEDNGARTFFDVMVACARKRKLESVKAVVRYDPKVLRIGECRNFEMKYGSAVIMTKGFVLAHTISQEMPLTHHSKAEVPQHQACN